MITFTVPAVPVPQPRQKQRVVRSKDGKAFATNYTPRDHPVQTFKATVRLALSQAYKGPPLAGPLTMTVLFLMPRPNAIIWKTKPMPRQPHTATPDLDNLLKSLKDALKGLAWLDDSQVFQVEAEKQVCAGDESARVEVQIQAKENV